MRSKLIIILVAYMLNGCGLRPLHYNTDATIPPIYLKSVTLHDEQKQFLEYRAKRTLLATIGNLHEIPANYTLKTEYTFGLNSAIIQSDTTAVRQINTLNLRYVLESRAGGKVASGKIIVKEGYNTPDSPYSAYVSQQSIKVLLIEEAAYFLKLRLAQVFKQEAIQKGR